MSTTKTRPKTAPPAELRKAVLERFSRKLDKYLPEEGPLRPWKLAQIEAALSRDMDEIARDVIESRIYVDPARVPEKKPTCPKCGKPVRSVDWDRSAHRITIFGKVHYRRAHAPCHACGVAFSPSGHCVRHRQGLL